MKVTVECSTTQSERIGFVDEIMSETCAICGCLLHRGGGYAKPTLAGRSHATRHHYVAERFFGRTQNRRGTQRTRLLQQCPWGMEREVVVFCYECHEELIHNVVFLPEDIEKLAELVRKRRLNEKNKSKSRKNIAGRIKLLHEVVEIGRASSSERV